MVQQQLSFPHIPLFVSDPILTYGTEEQKQKYLFRILHLVRRLGAFGLTEPGAGTDAQGQQTKAVLDGDEWVLNGSKCFITNGKYADVYIIIAVYWCCRKTR